MEHSAARSCAARGQVPYTAGLEEHVWRNPVTSATPLSSEWQVRAIHLEEAVPADGIMEGVSTERGTRVKRAQRRRIGELRAAGGQAPGGGDRVVASGDTERLAVPVVRQLEWLTTGDSLETATTVPALGPQGVSKSDPL